MMEAIVKTHIGSYGIMIKNEKIALIKKARGGYKGKLDLPGGGIEHTELPEETLKREIMEEVGINITNYHLLDVVATNIKWEMEKDLWEDLHHIGILYVVKTNENKLKDDADGLDSDGANWYNIKELKQEDLSPFAKLALEKMNYNTFNVHAK